MIDAMYELLAKVGFTEPLHSPITHMPIGLIAGSLIFFVVAILFKRRQLVYSARHCSILAFVFVFPTILLGVFDWIHFYHAVLMPAIKIKMILAGCVMILLGAGIILGSEIKVRNFWMATIYALSFLSVAALGWFGAGIIYGRGVAVETDTAQAVAPAIPGAQTAGESTARAGQAVFAANCQACHGNGGNVITPSLPLKGSRQLASLDAFVAFVRAPTMPDGSAGSMPAFTPGQVSDAQAKDLYAYVTTAWR